jgi:ribose/xylose/arabinose/galactoside ABC-type transport system permease subunit
VARTGVGDPNAGQTENLDAITAVVLGGTSLFGGRGIIWARWSARWWWACSATA